MQTLSKCNEEYVSYITCAYGYAYISLSKYMQHNAIAFIKFITFNDKSTGNCFSFQPQVSRVAASHKTASIGLRLSQPLSEDTCALVIPSDGSAKGD